MHTQLKALPSSEHQHHHQHYQSHSTIQQLATTGVGQQGTIITKSNNKSIVGNVAATNHHIPVAFVEFSDVQSAGRAMQMLQGKYLLSSDRGAMHIEYAKSSASFSYPFNSTTTTTAILNGRPH